MKTLKRISQITLLFITILLSAKNADAQTISNHFFGENAWMPDTIGNVNNCNKPPCLLNGKLHTQWQAVKEAKTSIVRFGGISPDHNIPTNYQYIRMIDSIRANGMEPIMQVPFDNYHYTAQQAADIVQYINVVKGRNVKYWIIGNEPNLDYGYTTAAQIAAYIKPFASAMKVIDPAILIIGPEVAWFHHSIMTALTTPGGPDDITGKDASGRNYIDVISFHTYPFDGNQTREQVISKLTEPYSLEANLITLNTRIAACNTFHNRTGAARLKTAITEANISYQNSSSDNLYGVGTNSFIGGQFMAQMLGISLKHSVDFVNIWSVIEGNNVQSSLGFIEPGTYNKKPSYYHFKMMAENFKGEFVNATSNQLTVKTFGSKDASEITVIILNEDATTNFNYTVRLNNSPITASGLKVNLDAGLDGEYSDVISSQSTTLLTFDAMGNILEKTEYKLVGHANANLPPVKTVLAITTDVGSGGGGIDAGVFEFKNVYPNPSSGNFTLAVNKGSNASREDMQVELFSITGQKVYSEALAFENGKEEIALSPDMAAGTYIVRVKEGKNDNYLTKNIVLTK